MAKFAHLALIAWYTLSRKFDFIPAGRLDEAALYNRALTAKEIADHVAAAK
jgi:hypothetical protein